MRQSRVKARPLKKKPSGDIFFSLSAVKVSNQFKKYIKEEKEIKD